MSRFLRLPSFLALLLPIAAVVLALAVWGSGVGVQPASATAPTNDDFANATAITDADLPYTDDIADTSDATLEGGEPISSCGYSGEMTIWYAFTPSVDVTVVADTFGSDYDTVLAAYTGASLGDLAEVTCNDDSGGLQSRVVVAAAAGETIFFQANGYYNTDYGNSVFNLAVADPRCVDMGEMLCISLLPETDLNPVDTDHEVTATLSFTVDGQPVEDGHLSGDTIDIVVFDGPNAGDSTTGPTDANGQLGFTYTGDGGTGTDSIIALSCNPGVTGLCEEIIGCLLEDPGCLVEVGEVCLEGEDCIFDVATKTWEPVPTPTPTPTPTATPTPTPTATATPTPTPTATVLAAVQLPATGGAPSGGSGVLPWLAAIAGSIVVMASGGLWLAYQRRRAR